MIFEEINEVNTTSNLLLHNEDQKFSARENQQQIPSEDPPYNLTENSNTVSDTKISNCYELQYSVEECCIGLVVYIFAGIIAFSFIFENWSIVESFYYSVVTLTTVGNGDLYPTSDSGKTFACFWALFGIVILAVAIGVISDSVIKARIMKLREEKKNAEYASISKLGFVPTFSSESRK